jgi:hypothetical protein
VHFNIIALRSLRATLAKNGGILQSCIVGMSKPIKMGA